MARDWYRLPGLGVPELGVKRRGHLNKQKAAAPFLRHGPYLNLLLSSPPCLRASARETRPQAPPSHIQILHIQRILFNKLPPVLHVLPHQRREDLLALHRILQAHLQQRPLLRVHRGLRQLLRVHFPEPLVPRHRGVPLPFVLHVGQQVFPVPQRLPVLVLHHRKRRLVVPRDLPRQRPVPPVFRLQRQLQPDRPLRIRRIVEHHRVRRVLLVPPHLRLQPQLRQRLEHRPQVRFFLELRLVVHPQLDVPQNLHHPRVPQPPLHLVEHLLVLIQVHEEIAQLLPVQHRLRTAIARRVYLQAQVLRRPPHDFPREFLLVLDVLLALPLLDPVEGRLRDEHVAFLDQLVHVPEEERQQQRADVAPVHVRVRHDDDLAVPQLGRGEIVLADPRPQRRDHRPDLLVPEHLVVPRLLHVQDLALQRQDRLEPPVAPLLRRPARRFALDQEQLAALRVPLLAVRQLVRHPARFERSLAPRQVASLARRLPRARRLDRLPDDLPSHRRILIEKLHQFLVDEGLHRALDVAVQLALRLPFELRLRHLHAHHRRQSLADVVAGQVLVFFLEQPLALAKRVHRPRQRRVESLQVRPAVHRVDVVCKTENRLRISVVVLESELHVQHAAVRQVPLPLRVDRLIVQHRLAAVQVLDEFRDPAREQELRRLLLLPLVRQRDLEALVQKRQLPQPRRQRVVVEYRGFHDRRVRLERNPRSRLPPGLSHPLQRRLRNAARILLLPGISIAPDLELQPLAQRIHAAHAHAVQPARNLVTLGIELSARVQLGHDHLRRRYALILVDIHRNPAPVVDHRDRIIVVDRYRNFRGIPRQRLIDRVIHHLVHQVMQPHLPGRPDIHRRPQPYGLQPLENLDAPRIIFPGHPDIYFISHKNFVSEFLRVISVFSASLRLVPSLSPQIRIGITTYRY